MFTYIVKSHSRGPIAVQASSSAQAKRIACQILRGVVPPSAFIKLTPSGVDLVEGTIEDPGVDV